MQKTTPYFRNYIKLNLKYVLWIIANKLKLKAWQFPIQSLYLVPFLKQSTFRGACKLHFTDAADGEKLLHCLGIEHSLTP